MTSNIEQSGKFILHRDPKLGNGSSGHPGKYTLGAVQDWTIHAEAAGIDRDAVLWFTGGTPQNLFFKTGSEVSVHYRVPMYEQYEQATTPKEFTLSHGVLGVWLFIIGCLLVLAFCLGAIIA